MFSSSSARPLNGRAVTDVGFWPRSLSRPRCPECAVAAATPELWQLTRPHAVLCPACPETILVSRFHQNEACCNLDPGSSGWASSWRRNRRQWITACVTGAAQPASWPPNLELVGRCAIKDTGNLQLCLKRGKALLVQDDRRNRPPPDTQSDGPPQPAPTPIPSCEDSDAGRREGGPMSAEPPAFQRCGRAPLPMIAPDWRGFYRGLPRPLERP